MRAPTRGQCDVVTNVKRKVPSRLCENLSQDVWRPYKNHCAAKPEKTPVTGAIYPGMTQHRIQTKSTVNYKLDEIELRRLHFRLVF